MLQKFADLFAKALFDYAVQWLKNPDNRADVEKAGEFVAVKFTAATPWAWDDKLATTVASVIEGKLPDFGPLNGMVQQLQQLVKNIPFGGFMGGH